MVFLSSPLVFGRPLPAYFFFNSSLIVMFNYQGKVCQMLYHKDDAKKAEIFQAAFGSDLGGASIIASPQGGALHVTHRLRRDTRNGARCFDSASSSVIRTVRSSLGAAFSSVCVFC